MTSIDPTDRPWQRLPVPAEAARIPGMLSAEEKQYLYWVTRHAYEGWGAVVDLGPWVGCSSAALAAGLRDRGATTVVRSFDLFEWVRYYMEKDYPAGLAEGADFLPLFRQQTAPLARWIQAEKMNLLEGRWDGGEIEILFVDAAKGWELNNAVTRVFGPHLRPGRTRVIQQDFRHYSTVHLPLTIDTRPDVWRQIEAVEEGMTVTFVPQRALFGAGGLKATYVPSDFTYAQSAEVLGRRVAAEHTLANKTAFRLGWLIQAMLHGDTARADELRREVAAVASDLRLVGELFHVHLHAVYELYEQQRFDAALQIAQWCVAQQAGNLEALNMAGYCAMRLRRPVETEDHLRRSLAVDGEQAVVHLHLAATRLDLGKHHEACAGALAALARMTPDSHHDRLQWAFWILEQGWQVLGHWPDATLADLAAKFGALPEFHVLQALSHHFRGAHAQALTALRHALTLAPDHARALQLLSLAEKHATGL